MAAMKAKSKAKSRAKVLPKGKSVRSMKRKREENEAESGDMADDERDGNGAQTTKKTRNDAQPEQHKNIEAAPKVKAAAKAMPKRPPNGTEWNDDQQKQGDLSQGDKRIV